MLAIHPTDRELADRWRLIVARHEGFRRWCRVKLAQLLRRVTVRLDP